MGTTQKDARLRLDPLGGPGTGPFTFSAEKPPMLGRGADCDACLPDATVSRRHAVIMPRAGNWFVLDLASRHGTFLNGLRLLPNHPTLVGEGDLLRIGPFTMRISLGGSGTGTVATRQDAAAPGTIVEPVPVGEPDSLAQRRLALMIDGSAAIHRALTEQELARAVIELILEGTGYPRVAVLRYLGSVEEVQIVAFRDLTHASSTSFTFSRSLLQATIDGDVARLSQQAEVEYGQSIDQLGITTAICAPLVVDSAVIGGIYLDARVRETQGYPDAAGFCRAVSRLAGLALSSLMRTELEARQKQLDADLKIARRAQEFLYPPQQGEIGRLAYTVSARPGRIVAGDLFDIFPIDERRTGICFGDVTGQGMGAALLMTAILSHLRAALARYREPAAAVADVNAYITGRSPDNMFASLWAGVFEQDTGALRYVDAGHGHWLIKRRNESPFVPEPHGGLLVGIESDYHYSAQCIEMNEADRIVLFSDGVIEHMNAAGEDFGRDRLLEVIGRSSSIESDVADAFAALGLFIGGAELADDTTVASIQIRVAT